jgi:hypothetical protein
MAKKNDTGEGTLSQNRCHFNSKKPGPGTGAMITCCRLNKAAFVRIDTPTWHAGMDVHEARAAWETYLRMINR